MIVATTRATSEALEHVANRASQDVKLAIVLFCFPPNKGNIGTAADLDVFPGVFDVLKRLDAKVIESSFLHSRTNLRGDRRSVEQRRVSHERSGVSASVSLREGSRE
jgi:hypothetical protein